MASADSYITTPEEPGSIMCSVLNLIFDHSMEDPTPMEPEEYRFKQQNPKSPLKVPVIRIFGPLLRDPRSRPLQSACLHIHGAFPYLLARPVIAGPDGSLRRALPVDGQVNWDDPVSVELIVKPLQSILEDAIQALDMKRILGDAQDFAGTSIPRENRPVIRKITVVQGRGFFTYCPGPPAPFLKVEYYDPKLRWKVKLMLERGLQVPLAYFPDPAQYDQEVTDENPDALRFNCYEAHIPYSMQFFKDWNLAGMSYLHIQQGKIRPALRESLLVKYRAEPFDSNRDGPAVFLRFNTPRRYLWRPSEADCRDHDGYYHDPSFPPPPKATNSDVEIDCSVYDLRNVDDVLKTPPSAEEERDKIQWRAVPSLQEIWRQERRRMAKLLTPEKDFLTPHPAPTMETPCQKVPPPFTLNVKQGSERSGSRLACKGMRSLVRLTHGLEEEFERSLHQILKRHQHAIQQVDRELLNPPKKAMSKETPAKATKCGCDEDPWTPSFDEAADALSSLAVATEPKTPSLADAMNALESLYRGVDDLEAPQSTDTPRGALNRNDQDVIMEDENTRLQFTHSQQSQTSVVLSYPSSQELHDESDKKAFSDPAFLSQRVDRGDSIFHDEGTVHDTFEECIDPKTLLPYDHLDFGVNRCPGNISNHACMSSSQSLRPSSYVQPTRSPPTRRSMVQWWKRTDVGTVHKANQESNQPVLNVGPRSLEIDANSRKIVAFAHGDSEITKSAGSMTTPNRDVEVAVWEPSQAWQLSMTQQSQGEGIDSRLEPRTDQKMVVEESQFAESTPGSNSQASSRDALEGIGAQGGKIHVEGGGTLKTRTRATPRTPDGKTEKHISTSSAEVSEEYSSTPISFMSVEIHVQCRTGVSRLDSKRISMAPDSSKDKIFAIVYLYGIDPGGGESLQVLERCCLFLKFDQESTERTILAKATEASMPRSNLGMTAPLHVECLDSEKKLLLRFSSLVTAKDPDMLMSWDTQSAGLGYMIERALVLNHDVSPKNQRSDQTPTKKSAIDLVRLLGRTPFTCSSAFSVDENEVSLADTNEEQKHWKFKGSGLGVDWDERVGAGAAAASIVGRLVFAGWKIVAEEVKHPNSSYLPAVTAAVLNKRIPQHDDLVLTQWYASRSERWRVLHHRVNQAMATLLIFDALDIVGRAGEAARLSGVEFSQSFPGIRGSQYKVEGVLLRALQSLRSDERGSKEGKKILTSPRLDVGHSNPTGSSEISRDFKSQSQSPWKIRRGVNETKPSSENRHYFFYSPSKEDCDRQEALEVQALTLEPESGHYTDPVVVCDFTALYPSLVIAYNLCYSTCAGKLEYHSTRGEMQIEGKTTGRLGPFSYHERRTATVLYHHFKSIEGQTFPNETSKIEKKRDRGYIAPTGTLYVAEDALKGVLPQVLDEILTTRAMLKRASKEYKKNVKNLSPAVLRQLEARQLALKYVANVTYGYTSATFSGRCAMPLLADTIVECGRKTLRKAINMANCWGREGKWKGAKVIYGDTDSLFVQLPGRSYKEAFDFGEELCKAVTADNPPPVQLKLEKVYLGSIMQTMKRYCGMKFESRNDRKPSFEAKGLETVRRDQCALTQKVLRNALITLFRHGIDAVRDFLNRQWYLINAGHIPMSDFVLTGRVRSQYRGGREGPVQAVLAQRLAEADPGHTTRNKERIPYVIVATPGKKFKLKDCVLTPVEMLERWDGYTIHSAYYIERHVNPALARCLSLAPHHIDMNGWYRACPKPRRRFHFWPVRSKSRTTIDMHFGSDRCVLCEQRCKVNGRAKVVVCPKCREDHIRSAQMALSNLNEVQHEANELAKECSRCNGCFEDAESFASLVDCDSSDRKRKTIMSMVDGTLSDEHLKIPLANCVCIDCPNTFKRHHLRGQLIERTGTCEVLGLF